MNNENEKNSDVLMPCPSTPNCVSSIDKDSKHYIAPLNFSGSAATARERLLKVLSSLKRTRVVFSDENYIRAESVSAIMRFVDGVMVSRLGPATFSAQFVGGMTAFVFEAFLLGTLTAINTFVSQNLGARRYRRCSEYTWSGLMLAVIFSVVCSSFF